VIARLYLRPHGPGGCGSRVRFQAWRSEGNAPPGRIGGQARPRLRDLTALRRQAGGSCTSIAPPASDAPASPAQADGSWSGRVVDTATETRIRNRSEHDAFERSAVCAGAPGHLYGRASRWRSWPALRHPAGCVLAPERSWMRSGKLPNGALAGRARGGCYAVKATPKRRRAQPAGGDASGFEPSGPAASGPRDRGRRGQSGCRSGVGKTGAEIESRLRAASCVQRRIRV